MLGTIGTLEANDILDDPLVQPRFDRTKNLLQQIGAPSPETGFKMDLPYHIQSLLKDPETNQRIMDMYSNELDMVVSVQKPRLSISDYDQAMQGRVIDDVVETPIIMPRDLSSAMPRIRQVAPMQVNELARASEAAQAVASGVKGSKNLRLIGAAKAVFKSRF